MLEFNTLLLLQYMYMYLDEVLWWQRLKDRNEEADDVFVGGVLALEQKILVVQDDLAVHVLHQDPECLGVRRGRVTHALSRKPLSCQITIIAHIHIHVHTCTCAVTIPQSFHAPSRPTGNRE